MTFCYIDDLNDSEIQSFSCGNKDLDVFIKRFAKKNDSNGYGKTICLKDYDEFIGYFTLCSSSITFEEFPLKTTNMPKYPIPCVKIARLAVKKGKHHKGYGKELLKQAFIRILSVAETVGVRLVIVDAKETSKSFYEKYGFLKLQESNNSYFLMIESLKEAFKGK